MNRIETILSKKAAIINDTLEEILDIKNPVSETLIKAMKYSLFSGGKRIRPILTLMVSEMIDGNVKIAKKVGSAIELIHTYSLIHDDLPSMDNDKYRRGQLSSHEFFDPGIAILAGDALLTYAFEIISKLNFEAEKKNEINHIISEGAGLKGMVAGQVLDLEGENNDPDLEELKLIHNHKTGALFKSSILAGAYCGEVIDKEIKSLKNFAYHLGLLFQITDDILDVIGDEEKLGKKVGQDQKNNKSTYPGILGLEKAKKEARNQAKQAQESLIIFGEKAVDLNLLIEFVLNRNF